MNLDRDTQLALRHSRIILPIILVYHGLLFVAAGFLLMRCLFGTNTLEQQRMFAMTALFALLGSLVYFSRKCYVYLITDKFGALVCNGLNSGNSDVGRIRRVITGYYLYLLFRPLTGLVIGPILYMLVISGGTITFSGVHIDNSGSLSEAGRYLICAASFLAGHAASDMFDYFSWIAASRIRKRKQVE